jgi:hypothetical protein
MRLSELRPKLNESRNESDILEAYWQGVTDLLDCIQVSEMNVDRIAKRFLPYVLPDRLDRQTTANMKLRLIKKLEAVTKARNNF